MTVSIHDLPVTEKPVLRHLMELYQYDFSELEQTDVGEHGLFGYRYLDHYWTEPGRHPLLIRVDEKIAGFALVNDHARTEGVDYVLAEFFVMRRYRRLGVGHRAARAVFSRFPGTWEVPVSDRNEIGRTFWRSVIADHIGSEPDSVRRVGWDGTIFRFTSSK